MTKPRLSTRFLQRGYVYFKHLSQNSSLYALRAEGGEPQAIWQGHYAYNHIFPRDKGDDNLSAPIGEQERFIIGAVETKLQHIEAD